MSTQTFISGETLAVAAVLVLFGSGKLRPGPQGHHHSQALRTAADALLARLPFAARSSFWPVLGATEVALGIWLILSRGARQASLVAVVLFTAMVTYLIWAKLRHPGKSCGCSGRGQEPHPPSPRSYLTRGATGHGKRLSTPSVGVVQTLSPSPPTTSPLSPPGSSS